MVFIHGGAFCIGSGSFDKYPPDTLIDEDVIVVTMNYRLNTLGEYIKTVKHFLKPIVNIIRGTKLTAFISIIFVFNI